MTAHTYDPACQCWQCLPRAQREAAHPVTEAVFTIVSDAPVDIVASSPVAVAVVPWTTGTADVSVVDSSSLVSQTPDFPSKDAGPGHYVELLVGGPDCPPRVVGVALSNSIYVVSSEAGDDVSALASTAPDVSERIHEETDPDAQLRKPPPQDARLLDFFTNHDLEPKSLHGSFEAMSATSFARGVPDPDRRMVSTGAVGFRQRTDTELATRTATTIENEDADLFTPERVSRAQRHRETRAILAQLAPEHVAVLRRAYGPQDQVPALKLGHDPGKSEKPGKETKAASVCYETRERLGPWRQLLCETRTAREAYATWCAEQSSDPMPIERWLLERVAPKAASASAKRLLSAIQLEAFRMVRAAHHVWAEKRGRRQRIGDETFEREEQVKPWDL